MDKSLLVLRNRLPAFIWVFTALWLVFLGVMTLELVTEGPPEGYSMLVMAAILGAFWVAGLGLAAYAGSKPCTSVTVDAGGDVLFSRRYPFRLERRRFPASAINAAEVVESTDDEGDSYFYARVSAGGESFDIAEGHDREHCEQVCGRFNEALSQ